jgi:hypothetical protein
LSGSIQMDERFTFPAFILMLSISWGVCNPHIRYRNSTCILGLLQAMIRNYCSHFPFYALLYLVYNLVRIVYPYLWVSVSAGVFLDSWRPLQI